MNKLIKKDSNTLRYIILSAALVFFTVRAVQMVTTISTQLAFPAATLYLLDFNFYLGSRTFIGSILTLLTPHITYQQIFILNISVYVIAVLTFLGMGISTFRKALKESNDLLFLSSILFIVCPYSLIQYSSWVGTYDIYLCLFAAIAVMMTNSEKLHWFVSVICVMAIFTHYAFVFSFFPALLAVQVYNITISDKKTGRIVSTAISFVVSFISAVYCGFLANGTIKMTRSELYAYMADRLGTEVENKPYIDSYYFKEDVFGMLGNFKNEIINDDFLINFSLYFLPVILAFSALWIYYITTKGKKQIISGGFFLLTVSVSVALIFLIIEAPRWQTAAILSQFLIFFTIIKKNDSTAIECLNKLNKKPINAVMLCFVVFSMIASFLIKPFFS